MDGIFLWLVAGAGGLVFTAVLVAWWEHLGRNERPPSEFASTPPRAVSVDVELDKLTAAPANDSSLRREALDGALVRMAQAGVAADMRRHWADTAPMVGNSLCGELPALAALSTTPTPVTTSTPVPPTSAMPAPPATPKAHGTEPPREFAPSQQP